MPYEAKATKTYNQPVEKTVDAIADLLKSAGGKTTKKNKPDQGYLEAVFNKKIKGKVMRNRVQLGLKVTSNSPDQSIVTADAFPVNPVGQKLAFGVPGNPAKFAIDTFFSALDENLQ